MGCGVMDEWAWTLVILGLLNVVVWGLVFTIDWWYRR